MTIYMRLGSKVAKLVMRADIDLNHRDKMYGWTPMHIAAREGNSDIIQLLLKKGANPNAKDNLGQTPLHRAAQRGHKQIVNYCLSSGADPLILDELEQSPGDLANQENHLEIFKILSKATKLRQKEIEEENKRIHKTLERERKREKKEQKNQVHNIEKENGNDKNEDRDNSKHEYDEHPLPGYDHSHRLGDLREKDPDVINEEDNSHDIGAEMNSPQSKQNHQNDHHFHIIPSILHLKFRKRSSTDLDSPHKTPQVGNQEQEPTLDRRAITLDKKKKPDHRLSHNLPDKSDSHDQSHSNAFFSGFKRYSQGVLDKEETQKNQIAPSQSVLDKGDLWLQYINGQIDSLEVSED